MIILLGLVVLGLLGLALVIAGAIGRNLTMGALGGVLMLLAVVVAVTIKASCDPGCEIGSGVPSILRPPA